MAPAAGKGEPPNIIGNVEDEQAEGSPRPDVHMEGDGFKDITSSLIRSTTRKMGKQHQQQLS